jgi:hypothetical protein
MEVVLINYYNLISWFDINIYAWEHSFFSGVVCSVVWKNSELNGDYVISVCLFSC